VTDQLMQRAGVTSIELMHGLTELQHQLGPGHSHTTIKAMWSVPEAEVVQPYRKQRIVGGYFPRPAPAPIQRAAITAGERVPVLVASAYLISAYGLDSRMF